MTAPNASSDQVAFERTSRVGYASTMTFMYFAYGSNMLTTRLVARCDSAEFHSKALVRGYKLEFTKKSRDGSGKATLKRSDSVACTPGVIFRISESQSAELDSFEGAWQWLRQGSRLSDRSS